MKSFIIKNDDHSIFYKSSFGNKNSGRGSTIGASIFNNQQLVEKLIKKIVEMD